MIIIYNCYGGTHSSILTSSVHLNILPNNDIPTKEKILELKYFNKLTYKDMGKLILHGVDNEGNKVYSLGRGTSKAIIPALRNLSKELSSMNDNSDSFIYVNTSPTVPLSMTFGGFFSRGLKLDFLGVPLLVRGAKKSYKDVISLCETTKKLCKDYNSSKVIIDIDKKGNVTIEKLPISY